MGEKWQILHPDCVPLIRSTVFALTHVSHAKSSFFSYNLKMVRIFSKAAVHLSHLQALTWPYLSTGLTFVLRLTDLLRNIPF